MRPGHHKRFPNWVVGLIAAAILGLASLYAFTSLLNLRLPWAGGYEVKAVFASAQNVRLDSPVRIAGVNVGTVTGVEHLTAAEEELTSEVTDEAGDSIGSDGGPPQAAAVVTMQITDAGRPIKTDATFQLRPRLFLEGNLFVDTKPGSPSAPEAPEDYVFPIDQTSNSVQIDQILTALQSDVRRQLQIALEELGAAFVDHGGAEGFQELYRTSPGAFKFTSQVNEAFLGKRPHDLSGLIKHLDRVVRGLGRNEAALKDLVTNFRIFSGSFAAQDVALQRAVAELPGVLRAARPAFANLNAAFPPLRAFAREALPGVRSSSPTIDAATPFLHQVRRLVSRRELRGLVADLRPTIPQLAKLARRTVPFLGESRRLSSCFNEVVIPWSNDSVDPPPGYPHPVAGTVAEETGYGLAGIAGESRSQDANGQYIRVMGGGGLNTVQSDPVGGSPADQTFGVLQFPIEGGVPNLELGPNGETTFEDSQKTRFRPQQPCERQEPPNLGATMGAPPPPATGADASALEVDDEKLRAALDRYGGTFEQIGKAQELLTTGKVARAQRVGQKAFEDAPPRLKAAWKRGFEPPGGGE